IGEKPLWAPVPVDTKEEKSRYYHQQQQLYQQQEDYSTEPGRPTTIEYQYVPEPQSPELWTASQGTVVQSPASIYSAHVHSHNPQLRYPDNLDYFPPPPPVNANARTSFSAAGSATAMYNNSVLHDSGVKVEFTQPPLARSPQEIVPYVQPLEVDISDPQGIVVPNQYRE
ncbi:hypothetical protein BGZ81_010192, partial [Podila clonocystis]